MGRANWLILTALAASLSAGGALAIEQDIEPLPEVEAEAAAPAAEFDPARIAGRCRFRHCDDD